MTGLRTLILLLATSAFVGAALLYLAHPRRRRPLPDPAATRDGFVVVASDVDGNGALVRDSRLGLCGKPDYLLEGQGDGRPVLVPMEIKPGRRSTRLYESDRIQIAAYLVALRGSFPDRASRLGLVEYATGTFDVVLTPDLEEEVVRLVGEIRRGRTAPEIHRSHDIAARCRACPVRNRCDERLG